jgi:hypothetical protein
METPDLPGDGVQFGILDRLRIGLKVLGIFKLHKG